ncbi:MAG: hypothetical protein H7Y42_11210 [Chitinophagaceae bacterium]|nr:hypothetical protein [Chitinophagaceae bacterium]
MLKFITSLSFLYALTIVVLLIYGFLYYRDLSRSARHRKGFPFVFGIISIACFAFLWVNMHAPLRLQTFTNLDHHFLQHDGFRVKGSIELGNTDSVNSENNPYNRFVLSRSTEGINVSSAYSEEPFYQYKDGVASLLSRVFDADGHRVSFTCDSISAILSMVDGDQWEMRINGKSFVISKPVRKGITWWSLFRDETEFIQSSYYNSEHLVETLKQVFILKDGASRSKAGKPVYFISGRVYKSVGKLKYDQDEISQEDLSFNKSLDVTANFGWSLASLTSNRNQYYTKVGNQDSFYVHNRYPISYPLTEEDRTQWGSHVVSKFLLSGSSDMVNLPPVFRQGFLFPVFGSDTNLDRARGFAPLLLTYRQEATMKSIGLTAQWMEGDSPMEVGQNGRLILPARGGSISWVFSLRNTFNWDLGGSTLTSSKWKALLFGSLLLFFLFVFLTSLITPAERLSWVWQLLACITIVMLTTRFFLYWRYKTFPPYEGLDLPSQQQLNSFWNFGVIILATIVLGLIFGSGLLRYLKDAVRARSGKFEAAREKFTAEKIGSILTGSVLVKRYGSKVVFFASWLLVLAGAITLAAARNFDPATCRHLAIGLTVAYFCYLYIAYRHSPLVATSEQSWWMINTRKWPDFVISNPAKVLLSISLLSSFIFIDIGFAIVFLNFLLFNEAFLCINYAIAGLSAGSRRNASLFGLLGGSYLVFFVLNLLYAPYIFEYLLNLPQTLYVGGYILFSLLLGYNILRLLYQLTPRRRTIIGIALTASFFVIAFFFFPKERILNKAAMTRYRIDVLTMPVDKAIASAYREGKTYEPVIRAAQNQWFINTLTYEENNPGVRTPGFNLLPHAPQNKGAKYNAQATDLVASRFFLAEHGNWSVLLYVLLLILPAAMLSSFYKLYPDFTNRGNTNYPLITAGFSILNYMLMTALLVILAATGRYIFFGQDMPFGSILSKQSILFPSLLIVGSVLLFRQIPLEYYANRKKLIPGVMVFTLLAVMLFFVKPSFNKNKEFNVADLSSDMQEFVQLHLQPVLDHFDTSRATRRLSLVKKDGLFSDSLRKLIALRGIGDENSIFMREATAYARADFSRHLDQNRMLYLDLNSGKPEIAVNENYFRIDPPPHLQQSWRGNVFGDSSVYDVSLLNCDDGSVVRRRMTSSSKESSIRLCNDLVLSMGVADGNNVLYLLNTGDVGLNLKTINHSQTLLSRDSLRVPNPWQVTITDSSGERMLMIEPDAFMRNCFVNGSRYYVYPAGNRFTWARHFAEGIASEYAAKDSMHRNIAVSLDFELMDSLSARIRHMMESDTAYKAGSEYGVSIADGNGRLIAISDHIKGLSRPDPNDKAGFANVLRGDNGLVPQSVLRKRIGNINLLRLNPGPGSTLKPVVFSAIASQMNFDWDAFSVTGFSEQQEFFGGEKVAGYDFEKNNGTISDIASYIKFSDNYYYSNVLLLGSYPKQELNNLLSTNFSTARLSSIRQWPEFNYSGKAYRLDGFEHWPGYENGETHFGSDSSFISSGLSLNYGIRTTASIKSFDAFESKHDSMLLHNARRKSGFILSEYGLFDQKGEQINKAVPYDVFANCFRGHVKGSSQVLIPPVKMVEAYGRLISQDRTYSLTLDPYAEATHPVPFVVDHTIVYNHYLSLMREGVFRGLQEALYNGTAAALGNLLSKDSPYHYYAKTGTTGDNEAKTKSKLMAVVISEKNIADPGFNFRRNRFYTIYFTSQNGPAKQNEQFQNDIIGLVERSRCFARYMDVVAK